MQTPTSAKTSASHWIALLVIVVLGGLQVYFHDVTFHGPDQIRDMEVARRLIHQHDWPLNGPPLFGERFHLPPGFYYLLALPLLIQDTESAVFIAFGLLFALSVWFLWRSISHCFGSRCALAYAVLAFPLFSSIYTHSAWNPALVMTFSNVVLGLFIRLVHDQQHGGVALPVAAFLLLQVHPSAVPLLCGLALFALVDHRAALNRKALATLAAIAGAISVWLIQSGAFAKLASTASPSGAPSHGGWLTRLMDLGKWRDVILMPYSVIESITPAVPVLQAIAAGLLALMAMGLLLSLALGARNRGIRWVWALTALWFVMSMAFLDRGAFWHLDVIHPWLALLSAYGLTRAGDKFRCPPVLANTFALSAFAMVLAGHMMLYTQLKQEGKYDLLAALLFFPRLDLPEHRIPTYAYHQLQALRHGLASQGICEDQLTGLEKLVIGDVTNRASLGGKCAPSETTAADQPRMRYFMAFGNDGQRFGFTRGLSPLLTVGASAVYAAPDANLRINGTPANNILSAHKLDYMTFAPARLDRGLDIELDATSATIVRVAFRCGKNYPIEDAAQWKVDGAQPLQPFASTHAWYLGSIYYDVEWMLAPAPGSRASRISSTLGPLDCDVSAIARPSVDIPKAAP